MFEFILSTNHFGVVYLQLPCASLFLLPCKSH